MISPQHDDDRIHLSDGGGTVDIDKIALGEAFARWRRGEVREALYQLEKAMDGNLHGLAELKPEDLL